MGEPFPWLMVGIGTTMIIMALLRYSVLGVWFVVMGTAMFCLGMITLSGLHRFFPWMPMPSLVLLVIAQIMWVRGLLRRRRQPNRAIV